MAMPEYKGGTNELGLPAQNKTTGKMLIDGKLSSLEQDAKTGKLIAKAGSQMTNDIIESDVLKANTEYTKIMNEKAASLLQTSQDGAKNVVDDYSEFEKKAREEVAKSLPKIGNRATVMFNSLAEKDTASQMGRLKTHQTVELEKYKDTTTNNALLNGIDIASKSYNDALIYNEQFAKGGYLVMQRYQNQGAEVVKAKQRDFTNAFYGSLIDSAKANDDYTSANKLLAEAVIKGADYTKLNGVREVLLKRQKADNKVAIINAAYSKYGKNIDGAIEEIRNSGGQVVDGQFAPGEKADNDALVAGMAAQEGAPYRIRGGTSCMLTISRAATSAGVNWRETAWVPDAVAQAQEKGIWKDADYVPKPGDVAIVNGEDHAVMYDGQGTWQAGESKDAVYHDDRTPEAIFGKENITGWIAMSDLEGHSSGKKAIPFSESEVEEYKKAYIAKINSEQSLKNMRINESVDNANSSFRESYEAGDMNLQTYVNKAKSLAGDDTELLEKLLAKGEWWYKQAIAGRNTSGFGGGLSIDKMPIGTTDKVRDMLRYGYYNPDTGKYQRYENKENFLNVIMSLNPNAAAFTAFSKQWDDYNEGKGEFKYDMEGVKSAVFGGGEKYSDSAKSELWRGAEDYIKEQINNFEIEKKRQPTYYEVIEMGKDAITKSSYGKFGGVFGFGGTSVDLSAAQLVNANIAYIEKADDGTVNVHWSKPGADGYRVQNMTLEQLNNIFN